MSTRISEWSCLIQWKYSSQSLHLAFQKGDSERKGDLGGFVWIVFDQTGPLLGSLLTFSIQRRWGTSRPSHHYKVFDSQTSVIRESRQGALCGCVRVCVCLCFICQFDSLQFANVHPTLKYRIMSTPNISLKFTLSSSSFKLLKWFFFLIDKTYCLYNVCYVSVVIL